MNSGRVRTTNDCFLSSRFHIKLIHTTDKKVGHTSFDKTSNAHDLKFQYIFKLRNFQKRRGLTGSQFLERGCWERGKRPFSRGEVAVFT